MRVAIVGAGYQGAKMVQELLDLQAEGLIEFSGVSDVSVDRLSKLLERLEPMANKPRFMPDHRDLLDYADAAIIATPNETHFDIAAHWIMSGKHVLVEKPVSVNSKDAMSLLEMARIKGVFIMPGHVYRFSKLLREIRRLIRDGEIGEVEAVNLRWVTPVEAHAPELYLDLLPHCFDLLHLLFDGQLPVVRAAISHRKGMHAYLALEYPGSVAVGIELGWNMPEKHRSIEVMGSERWLSTDVVRTFQFYHLTDPTTGKREDVWIAPNNTLADEVRGFVMGCRREKKDYVLMEAAIKGLELIESIAR